MQTSALLNALPSRMSLWDEAGGAHHAGWMSDARFAQCRAVKIRRAGFLRNCQASSSAPVGHRRCDAWRKDGIAHRGAERVFIGKTALQPFAHCAALCALHGLKEPPVRHPEPQVLTQNEFASLLNLTSPHREPDAQFANDLGALRGRRVSVRHCRLPGRDDRATRHTARRGADLLGRRASPARHGRCAASAGDASRIRACQRHAGDGRSAQRCHA
jgi:hypothetical protein